MSGPELVHGDDDRCPHMMWAMWDEDAAGDDAHIGFWRTSDGRIAVQSFQSNLDVRGRDMLDWLKRYGLTIAVVEAVPDAVGYWARMLSEGRISHWEPATGWPSDLEAKAVPLHRPDRADEGEKDNGKGESHGKRDDDATGNDGYAATRHRGSAPGRIRPDHPRRRRGAAILA